MIIDVSDLGDRVLQFDHALDLTDDASRRDAVEVRSARLIGRAEAGERGVRLTGRLQAEVSLDCSRCVEPFDHPVGVDFELTVVPRVEVVEEGEIQLDEEDLDLLEAPDGKVDLVAVAREQLWLELPLKPVCKPDCRGLCATCGGNRNRIECACPRDEPDPRLAPLLEFKKRMGDD